MSNRKRHDIWQYFEIKDNEAGKKYKSVACKFCSNEWKHGKVDDAIRHIAQVCTVAPLDSKAIAKSYAQERSHYQIEVEDMGEIYPDESVSQCSSNGGRKPKKRRRKQDPLAQNPPAPIEPEITPDIMPDFNSILATIQPSMTLDTATGNDDHVIRGDPELTSLALNWFLDAGVPFWHANCQTWIRLMQYLRPAAVPPSEDELRALFRDLYPDKQEPTRYC